MRVTRSDESWLTVSEAARALGMSRTTLLAAEETGLLTPMRTPGGHRRYRLADLRAYQGREAPEARTAEPPPADPAPPPGLAGSVRAAVRPLVQALDAQCAGVYLLHDGVLKFAGAFGVPRWLAERLAASPPIPPLVAAVEAARARLFDAADLRFPDARATGHGLATPLLRTDRAIGVLFLVRPGHALHPAELGIMDAFCGLLGQHVEDQVRIAGLEQRLARIAAVCRA